MSLYYSARYMTVTCNVREEWRAKIPAVVHVDGTARPQLARRQDNPVYYDILHAYERRTGVPVTINTSFNVHEEPIINKPKEALKALEQGRVDYLVTEQGLYAKA
jgi:carbamoyltransferase